MIIRKGVAMYILIVSLCAVVVLFTMIKTHHFFKSFMLSFLQGIAALFAVNLIGDFLNVHIALNIFSISVGVLGGLPGIIFLLVSNIFML